MVKGHTVRAALVDACLQRLIARAPQHQHPRHTPPDYRPPAPTPTPFRLLLGIYPPLTAPCIPLPLSSLPRTQSKVRDECASCQAVNGILPPNGINCSDHGTHVASIVGGLDHGVAKEVTLVPAFSCFSLLCFDGRRRTCGNRNDVRANLEYVPRPPAPPRGLAATGSRPQHSNGRAPPSLLQVGADRLCSAPRSALRSNPGYTQRRHPRRHPRRATWLSPPWAIWVPAASPPRSGLGTAL